MSAGASLEGKTAIITGASNGQGAAAATLFVAEGANVLICDVQEQKGQELAVELGPRALFFKLDISNAANWSDAIAACVDSFGGVDVLINNAAVYDWLSIECTSEADFERFWRVNQLGTFLGMRAVIDPMKARDGGSIINVSSVGGAGGYPGIFAYATSKWAIRGMTKCAARDLGQYGIRVNSILPGVIETNMIAHLPDETKHGWLTQMPLGRLGEPLDVAKVALFLASDASSYVTGTDVTVDAGMTA
jgi:3alpha(or 20beta)-hydroxysteroid dehydrogenase